MRDSTQSDTPSASLEGLTNLITHQSNENLDPKLNATTRRIPPLEKWQPEFCGDMDLTIKANGEWWHEGKKMTRQSLVNLFSSVLWCEKNPVGELEYFLKTPVEKIKIQVEDAPLLIIQVDNVEKDGKTYLEFSTPQGDKVIADEQHPIILRQANNALAGSTPQPYILVRQNGNSKLYGLIHRNVFYHLVSMGELRESATGQDTCLILHSGECVFTLSVPND